MTRDGSTPAPLASSATDAAGAGTSVDPRCRPFIAGGLSLMLATRALRCPSAVSGWPLATWATSLMR